jgi:hypothetical protein
MKTITVDYAVLMWMAIILFSMVGFFRGWWKEGITTGFLTLLVALLKIPRLATLIVDTMNKFIKLLYIVVMARSLDIKEIADKAGDIGDKVPRIDATDYRVYILGLIGVLILSYLAGKIGVNKTVIGPNLLGALLGAIFGLLNGFTVVSLVREYTVGRYLPGVTEAQAAEAEAVTGIALNVGELPSPSVADGWVPWLIVAIGVIILFAVLATRVSVERTQIKGVAPPLYRTKSPSTSVAVAGVSKTE